MCTVTPTTPNNTALSRAFTERITTLGISRREFTKRSGLSRQTIHNIEKGGRTVLNAGTYAALDRGLYWRPGTALALSQDDESVLEYADQLTVVDRESATRWRIVERISSMSLAELDRLAAQMESGTSIEGESPNPSTRELAERLERLERSLNGHANAS